MVLQALDQLGFEGLDLAGDAERAVIHVPAGAAGDLAEFGRRQVAVVVAVELAQAGEGDVIEIEVEAHADGVGRHQEVHVAVLIERDLRVAGARAQRPEHDRGAAALAAHQLGDGVDVARPRKRRSPSARGRRVIFFSPA